MKIAHIGNTAGVASIIAEEQRKENHMVEVFVFDKSLHRQFGGTFIDYRIVRSSKSGKKSVNLKWFLERRRLFSTLKDYNVWHYHYPYGSLKHNIERWIRSDQILLNHYHGDDIRNKYDNHFCVVSTPDLLKFTPNGIWIPIPVNIDYVRNFLQNDLKHEKTLKVAHYPYYKNNPNFYADYYSVPLLKLEKKGKCKVVTIYGHDHPTTLKILSECDVVLGKILPSIGWFGKFELEAMALGKPVITYVSEELYEKYKPPVYRTSKDAIEKDLQTLLEDINEQKRLSTQGRSYIKQNHSAKHVCKLVEKCYQKCSELKRK